MFKQFTRLCFFNQDDGAGDEALPADDQAKADDDQAVPEEDAFAQWLSTQPTELQTQFKEKTQGLVSALKKERKNAQEVPALKKQVLAFQAAETEAQRAQRTKEENLASDLSTSQGLVASLKADKERLLIEHAVERQAIALKFADPTDALALLPKGSVTVDDEGKVLGHVEAVKALAAAKPHLIAKLKPESLGSLTKGKEFRKQSETETKETKAPTPARARF